MFYIMHWAAFFVFIFQKDVSMLIASGLFGIAAAISSHTYIIKKINGLVKED